MLIQMPTHYMKQSAAAITNHPAAITSPHANTSRIIRDIVMIAHTTTMSAITIILSALLSFRASAASRGIYIVMADPIGHLPTSSPHQ